MEKDYEDNDPERLIFRTVVGPMQMEPSEKFWKQAEEGILERENAVQRRKLTTWKGISFGLATVIVLLCFHEFYITSKVDRIEKKISDIEYSNHQQTIQNTTVENGRDAWHDISTQNVTGRQSNSTISENTTITKTYSNRVAHFNTSVTKTSSAGRNAELNSQGEATLSGNTGLTSGNLPLIQTGKQSNKEISSILESNNARAGQTIEQPKTSESPALTMNTNVTRTNKSPDTTINTVFSKLSLVPKQLAQDTAELSEQIVPPKPHIDFVHRIFASAFFATGSLNDFLKDKDNDNDATDKVSINSLKAIECNAMAYQAGLKLGFDISDKWSLQTGFYYNSNTYSIRPTIIDASQQEYGALGYSLITSSGIVNIPYSGSSPHSGDSIKVNGSSSRGYIGIPVNIMYKFLSGKKLGFYAIAGLSANILVYQGTSLHWQNTLLQEGDVSAQSIKGLESVHYSYSLGFRAAYKLGRGFSLFGEPYLQGALTSIDKNSPIVTYPYFFGIALGISYHF